MALIMVVDDDPAMLEMIREVLAAVGHELVLFQSGGSALEYLKDSANRIPKLILTDVMMPDLDGYSFSTILQEEKRTRGVPLIVITAKGALRQVFEPARNVAAFLEKPFDLAVLRHAVEKTIEEGLHR